MEPKATISNEATSSSSKALVVTVLAAVFAVNLAILAYSVRTGTNHPEHPPAEHPVAPAQVAGVPPAPSRGPETGTLVVAAPVAAPAPPAVPAIVNPITLPDPGVIQGMYVQHCAACHGLTGRGDGPAASQLYPRPRDFVESPFRFAPIGGGQEELVLAVERTIRQGVSRSSMPGFRGVLEEPVVAGLARYVVSLRAGAQPGSPTQEVEVGTRPPTTPGLIARGAHLFDSLGCVACHGATGHGDGPSSRTLLDSVGRPVRPADLTSGLFKAGQTPEDLCRVVLKGIPGTPMAAFEASVTTTNPDGTRNLTDAWALVAFVQSLQPKTPPIGVGSGAEIAIVEAPDEGMIHDPAHVAWLGVTPSEIELKPIWQREETINHVTVRAVKNATQIALALEWRDPSMDIHRDQGVFPDGAAVMFSLGKEVPALPMGVHIPGHQPEAPVNIWHWQADRQFVASTPGAEQGGSFEQPTEKWKLFLLSSEAQAAQAEKPSATGAPPELPNFRSAEEAGNIPALPTLSRNSVLESNAEGFGTLTPQPVSDQNVLGTAVWTTGLWRVVLVRDLAAAQEADIRLDQTGRIPVTFAVWDGAKRDRDGLKLVSGWHWLLAGNSTQSAQAPQASLESNPSTPTTTEVKP
ncbi:MAG: c-type cytochrome [Candidatus Omnitrophica bacterium]|nr:hypothetical protein [bacterium]NUN95786.1 c-type cytochrome [Candidatus Omnitrophota bacterium]